MLLSNEDDIIFITAYKDIGRSNWPHFQRTNQAYFECFIRLIQNIKYRIVVYIDDDIKKKLDQFQSPNIIFKDLSTVETFLLKYVEDDRIIMSSDTYKNKIPNDRKQNPEHLYSEYNFINHSKINFVSDAKKYYPNYKFYSWIDFGYVRDVTTVPANLKLSNLPHKIIYHCIHAPTTRIDPTLMLRSHDIYLTGSSFIIHNSLVHTLEELYEKKIIEWQQKFITDDDQNLILQIYYDHPNLFHLNQDRRNFSFFNIL